MLLIYFFTLLIIILMVGAIVVVVYAKQNNLSLKSTVTVFLITINNMKSQFYNSSKKSFNVNVLNPLKNIKMTLTNADQIAMNKAGISSLTQPGMIQNLGTGGTGTESNTIFKQMIIDSENGQWTFLEQLDADSAANGTMEYCKSNGWGYDGEKNICVFTEKTCGGYELDSSGTPVAYRTWDSPSEKCVSIPLAYQQICEKLSSASGYELPYYQPPLKYVNYGGFTIDTENAASPYPNCIITADYCHHFRTDFNNNNNGLGSCYISQGQDIAELIFGKTITRQYIEAINDVSENCLHGNPLSGSCAEALARFMFTPDIIAFYTAKAFVTQRVDAIKNACEGASGGEQILNCGYQILDSNPDIWFTQRLSQTFGAMLSLVPGLNKLPPNLLPDILFSCMLPPMGEIKLWLDFHEDVEQYGKIAIEYVARYGAKVFTAISKYGQDAIGAIAVAGKYAVDCLYHFGEDIENGFKDFAGGIVYAFTNFGDELYKYGSDFAFIISNTVVSTALNTFYSVINFTREYGQIFVTKLASVLRSAEQMGEDIKEATTTAVNAVKAAGVTILDTGVKVIDWVGNAGQDFVNFCSRLEQKLQGDIIYCISQMGQECVMLFEDIYGWGEGVVNSVVGALKSFTYDALSAFNSVVSGGEQIVSDVANFITGSAQELGRDVCNTISSVGEDAVKAFNAVGSVTKEAVGALKRYGSIAAQAIINMAQQGAEVAGQIYNLGMNCAVCLAQYGNKAYTAFLSAGKSAYNAIVRAGSYAIQAMGYLVKYGEQYATALLKCGEQAVHAVLNLSEQYGKVAVYAMANYGREIADTIAIGGEKAIQALVAYGSVAVNAIKQYGSDILSGAKSVEEAIANFAEKSYNEVVGGLKAAESTIASWGDDIGSGIKKAFSWL